MKTLFCHLYEHPNGMDHNFWFANPISQWLLVPNSTLHQLSFKLHICYLYCFDFLWLTKPPAHDRRPEQSIFGEMMLVAIARFLIARKIDGTSEFTLINIRKILWKPKMLHALPSALWHFVQFCQPGKIPGASTGTLSAFAGFGIERNVSPPRFFAILPQPGVLKIFQIPVKSPFCQPPAPSNNIESLSLNKFFTHRRVYSNPSCVVYCDWHSGGGCCSQGNTQTVRICVRDCGKPFLSCGYVADGWRRRRRGRRV